MNHVAQRFLAGASSVSYGGPGSPYERLTAAAAPDSGLYDSGAKRNTPFGFQEVDEHIHEAWVANLRRRRYTSTETRLRISIRASERIHGREDVRPVLQTDFVQLRSVGEIPLTNHGYIRAPTV